MCSLSIGVTAVIPHTVARFETVFKVDHVRRGREVADVWMYAHVSKEACTSEKRDLFLWQKSPVNISMPEVCVSVKIDLFI